MTAGRQAAEALFIEAEAVRQHGSFMRRRAVLGSSAWAMPVMHRFRARCRRGNWPRNSRRLCLTAKAVRLCDGALRPDLHTARDGTPAGPDRLCLEAAKDRARLVLDNATTAARRWWLDRPGNHVRLVHLPPCAQPEPDRAPVVGLRKENPPQHPLPRLRGVPRRDRRLLRHSRPMGARPRLPADQTMPPYRMSSATGFSGVGAYRASPRLASDGCVRQRCAMVSRDHDAAMLAIRRGDG